MRAFDPNTGKSFFRKTRRRFEESGRARELVFSCYRRYPFLNRDRTRLWFLEALQAAHKEWPSSRWHAGLRPVRIEIDKTLPLKHETVR